MLTTRSTHRLRRTAGLALAPVLSLTAAACGGGDGAGSFCDRAGEVQSRLEEISDPGTEDFAAAVAELRDLDPPDEIADDWERTIDALESFAGPGTDDADPEVLAQLGDPALKEAGDRVDAYLTEECGL